MLIGPEVNVQTTYLNLNFCILFYSTPTDKLSQCYFLTPDAKDMRYFTLLYAQFIRQR
jgi:hypothetical protein